MAVWAGPRPGGRREIETQVVGDEEIESAIAVVVDERAARAPANLARDQTCRTGDVLEALALLVPVEHVAAEIRQEEIRPSVVVVVPGADARGPAGAAHARRAGDIVECAVAPVSIQPVRRRRVRGVRHLVSGALLQTRAAQYQCVEPAVAVVIDQRHTGAIGLDDEALAIEPAIDGRVAQPCAGCHVGEADAPGSGLAGGRRGRLAAAGRSDRHRGQADEKQGV